MKKYLFIILFIFSSNTYALWGLTEHVGQWYSSGEACQYAVDFHPYANNYIKTVNGEQNGYPTYACQIYNNSSYLASYTAWYISDICPIGQVINPLYGNCIPNPDAPSCPPAGEKKWLEKCTPVDPSSTVATTSDLSIEGNNGKFYDESGCEFEVQADDASSNGRSELQEENGVKKQCLSFPYTSTGEYDLTPLESSQSSSSRDNEWSPLEFLKKISQEYLKNVIPTDISIDSGGVETKVDETQESIIKPTYEVDTSTDYVRSDGDSIVKTTKITTKTNPDNSKIITTDTTYDKNNGFKVNVNKLTGLAQTTPENSTTSGTSTVTSIGSDGAVTSISSTGTGGSGTDNGSITGGNEGTTGTDADPGTPEGEEDGDCVDCKFNGDSPEVDGLYTPTDKTFDSVFTSFSDDVMSTGAVAAATSFFTISLPAGSCPVWSATIPYINFDLIIDQQCSPAMTSIWPYIQAVLLLVAGFVAFRWAFL